MKIITKEEEDKLGLLQIIETYTNRDKTLMQNLIVWTPHMCQEEIDYYRSHVPEGFSLYKRTKYYKDGRATNYPPDDVWYWEDDNTHSSPVYMGNDTK